MNRPRTLVGSAVPLVLLIGLVGFVPSAAAAAAPVEDDDTRALLLLRRAVVAASSLGYSGTQVVMSWRPDGDSARLVDVRQWADGRRVETLRDAADVVAPAGASGSTGASASSASRTAGVSRGAAERALSLRALDVLAASYQLRVTGRSWVAGRVATMVTVLRGDAVAARLWVDDRTGLLLRQEVNDAAGNVRRMFAFIEIRPGAPDALAVAPSALTADRRIPDAGPSRARAVTGAFVHTPPLQRSQAPAWQRAASDSQRQGWCASVECPDALPAGFRLLDVRRGAAAGTPVVQLVYSDGLSSISVFQQPGRLDPEQLAGFRADTWDGARVYVGEGWPLRLTWQGGHRVFTAVSDAATPDVHAAISTFPQERTETEAAGSPPSVAACVPCWNGYRATEDLSSPDSGRTIQTMTDGGQRSDDGTARPVWPVSDAEAEPDAEREYRPSPSTGGTRWTQPTAAPRGRHGLVRTEGLPTTADTPPAGLRRPAASGDATAASGEAGTPSFSSQEPPAATWGEPTTPEPDRETPGSGLAAGAGRCELARRADDA